MSFRIEGWPEGHPHLTTIGDYPFGWWPPTNPSPLQHQKRDGYASSFRRLYRSYKARAIKNGHEFTLTEQDFYEFTSQPCFYCASPPSRKASSSAKNPYLYNGLDREDSSKGYTLRNIRACCWEHNDLKGKLCSYQDLFRLCLAVVLSISSKTAVDLGDMECLDLLIRLFPNVAFLKCHRAALAEQIRANPNELRWNWLCKPIPRPTGEHSAPALDTSKRSNAC